MRNVDYDSMIASGNPVQYTLDLPMDTTPGSRWRYCTGASHILSVIIARAAGQPTLDFARENLFNPLDIETFTWEKDPQGNVYGGSMLSLKPRDLAKVGQLMLDSGMWNGTQIVPAAWVVVTYSMSDRSILPTRVAVITNRDLVGTAPRDIIRSLAYELENVEYSFRNPQLDFPSDSPLARQTQRKIMEELNL